MRVFHFVRQFYPAVGGLENHVRSLARQQQLSGHEVTVVTLNCNFSTGEEYQSHGEIDGVKIKRYRYFGGRRYSVAPFVLMDAFSADVLHIHCTDFFFDYLAITKFIHRKPMVITTHGGFFHTKYASKLKELYFNIITKFCINAYSTVIACSENDFEIFSKISSRIKLIHNGVEVDKFISEGWVPSGDVQRSFIYIGRLSLNKNISELIENLAEVLRKYCVKLYVVGNDFDGILSDLRKIVEDLDMQRNVVFLSDLDDERISVIARECRFICSASNYEGFGMTIVEGMGAKLIPIVSSIPSFENIVNSAGVGYVVKDKKSTMEAVVAEFSLSSEEAEDRRVKARKYALKHGWYEVANKISEVYPSQGYIRKIQGVSIASLNAECVLEYLIERFDSGERVNLAFANSHTINTAVNDKTYMATLGQFCILPDGIGVDVASYIKYGSFFKENLNGTDFVPRILDSLPASKIAIVGSQDGVAERARGIWEGKYPQHDWCLVCNGFCDEKVYENFARKIDENGVDVLLVAMGNPTQEKWILKYSSGIDSLKLAVGVGALLDFTAGKVKRAPLIVRKVRLEWLFRLAIEPIRMWRRYILGNLSFLYRCIKD